MIEDLLKCLQGQTALIDVSDPELVSKARDTYRSIIHRKNRGKDRRSDDLILKDSFHGTIREFGVVKLTNGVMNAQGPDIENFDRSTFGWDVEACGYRLEIKPQKLSSSYFLVKNDTAKSLIANREYYTYIIGVGISKVDKAFWRVIPCCMIHQEHFYRYHERSMYNSWQTVYNLNSNPCHILNDWRNNEGIT